MALRIYVRPGDVPRCEHAMESLKKSMKWDEDVFGLEYDLDTFMIVAIDDFNMGAMENKGLNVFNSKLVLANPETATDLDYHSIEAVIGHEYFHNWTGNRVTCRDWFQLSLKEGLTVLRDQQFSADMGSAADARIDDVRRLRAAQFPEDAGPMAHPVRPDSYIEINNFYTATVYQKGAEVVRMMHTLLGPDRFRKGMDLYFQRYDGQAVTCDDFASAMEDSSGVDLAQFRLWYAQAGTPDLKVEGSYDAAARRYTMTVAQSLRPTPGQPDKKPMHIPLSVGLLDGAGRDLPLKLAGEATAGGTTRVLDVRNPRDVFVFEDVPEKPVASLLRGFSAPVKLEAPRSQEELTFLMAHDSDPFARWEAGQQLGARLILDLVEARKAGKPMVVSDLFVDAIRRTLDDQRLDRSFIADAVTLPGLAFLGELMPSIDIEGLWAAQQRVRSVLSDQLADRWSSVYDAAHGSGPYRFTPEEVGRRRLRSTALAYLSTDKGEAARRRAVEYFEKAGNMTEQVAGLAVLAELGGAEGEAALASFWGALEGRAAGPRQVVRHPGTDPDGGHARTGRAPRRASLVRPEESQPGVFPGRRLRVGQSRPVPRGRRARLSVPRRSGSGHGQTQSADRGAAAVAARLLAALRRGTTDPDEARTDPDRAGERAVTGRLRDRFQEPFLIQRSYFHLDCHHERLL